MKWIIEGDAVVLLSDFDKPYLLQFKVFLSITGPKLEKRILVNSK